VEGSDGGVEVVRLVLAQGGKVIWEQWVELQPCEGPESYRGRYLEVQLPAELSNSTNTNGNSKRGSDVASVMSLFIMPGHSSEGRRRGEHDQEPQPQNEGTAAATSAHLQTPPAPPPAAAAHVPLACVSILLLPPAVREELTSWMTGLELPVSIVTPLLQDFAMLVEMEQEVSQAAKAVVGGTEETCMVPRSLLDNTEGHWGLAAAAGDALVAYFGGHELEAAAGLVAQVQGRIRAEVASLKAVVAGGWGSRRS
jgi:hypothetical protein